MQEDAKFISNEGQQNQQHNKNLTDQLTIIHFQTLNQINKCINDHQKHTDN